MNRWFACAAVLLANCLVSSNVFGQVQVPRIGHSGDGVADLLFYPFDHFNGELIIDPDGTSLGLIQIDSASGIFTNIADAVLPPGGIGFDTLTPTRIGWAALPTYAITNPWSIGNVALPGLTRDFLIGDLMTLAGGGLGSPNAPLNLIHPVGGGYLARDDFTDGNAEHPSVQWTPNTINPGDFDASSGDYVMTPKPETDPNLNLGSDALDFTLRNTSIRVRGKISAEGGSMGVAVRNQSADDAQHYFGVRGYRCIARPYLAQPFNIVKYSSSVV